MFNDKYQKEINMDNAHDNNNASLIEFRLSTNENSIKTLQNDISDIKGSLNRIEKLIAETMPVASLKVQNLEERVKTLEEDMKIITKKTLIYTGVIMTIIFLLSELVIPSIIENNHHKPSSPSVALTSPK